MMKYIICVPLMMCILYCPAQKVHVAAGPLVSFPINSLSANLKPGLGPNVDIEYLASKTFSIGIATSYLFFAGKNKDSRSGQTQIEDRNADLRTFLLGLKGALRFSNNFKFHLALGYANSSTGTSVHTEETTVPSGPRTVVETKRSANDYEGQEGNFWKEAGAEYNYRRWHFGLAYSHLKNAYGQTVQTNEVKSLHSINLRFNYRLVK